MTYLEIDDARIFLLGDNTIKTIYKDGALINTKHLEKIRKAYTTLHGSVELSALKLVVIFDGEINFNQDVGHTYLDSRYRDKTAEALVTNNKKTKEYIDAVVQIINTKHQIKVFSDEKEALSWIKEIE